MRLIDTNAVLALLRDDAPSQSDVAHRALLEAAADDEPWVVAECVFAELTWVLESSYGAPRDFLVEVLGMVLESPNVRAWDPALATMALVIMAGDPRLDAVDALLAARARTADATILTFDGALREAVIRPMSDTGHTITAERRTRR